MGATAARCCVPLQVIELSLDGLQMPKECRGASVINSEWRTWLGQHEKPLWACAAEVFIKLREMANRKRDPAAELELAVARGSDTTVTRPAPKKNVKAALTLSAAQ